MIIGSSGQGHRHQQSTQTRTFYLTTCNRPPVTPCLNWRGETK
jgi:hypothetical protein